MSAKQIPVAEPVFDESEQRNVAEALRERAISGAFGKFIGQFESRFAKFCGSKHAVAVSNGTTAIHLALAAIGIGPGDEVLASTYTNMATFFPILQQGATPIPIDVEPDTWNMDVAQLESRITKKSKAIIVVHIFGHPVDMDPVMSIARKYGLHVIEDCAEAHGALYRGRPVGSIGTIGCFSFYANKIITTGEGGMLTMDDPGLADRAASLKSLAFGKVNKFQHLDMGFNYRMPNLQAAIGCAQLDKIDKVIELKRSLARRYNERLGHLTQLRLPVEKEYAKNVYWMYHLVLEDGARKSRDAIMASLAAKGIETRPGFLPYNMQDIFIRRGLTELSACPIANYIGTHSFYLPSGPILSDSDMDYVCEALESEL